MLCGQTKLSRTDKIRFLKRFSLWSQADRFFVWLWCFPILLFEERNPWYSEWVVEYTEETMLAPLCSIWVLIHLGKQFRAFALYFWSLAISLYNSNWVGLFRFGYGGEEGPKVVPLVILVILQFSSSSLRLLVSALKRHSAMEQWM